MNLHFKLASVQYREPKYGLLVIWYVKEDNSCLYHVMGFGQRLEEDSLQHGQLKDPRDPNNQKTNSLNIIIII